MSKKLKMPEKGLFGLPSSVRQTNNEEKLSTHVPENQDTEEPNNSDTSISENSDTQELENLSIQVLKNSDTKEPNNTETTEILKNSNIQVLKNPSTQVPENSSSEIPENGSTEQLKIQDTQVAEGLSTKTSGYQGISTLPKPQKNNRTKDDKKPARKQASIHLTGATLKALHLYAYEEGLEKSEVVEKALRKFIPKRFF